jgi:hypothetical protein
MVEIVNDMVHDSKKALYVLRNFASTSLAPPGTRTVERQRQHCGSKFGDSCTWTSIREQGKEI